MAGLKADADQLDEVLISLFQHLKRPATWQRITTIAGVNIDRPSAGIIHILCKHGSDQYTLNDLADKLGVESPTVTRKTQQLAKEGLLTRTRSIKDRRSIFLKVTESGKDIDQRIIIARRKLSEQALINWPEQDRRRFVELFERYINDLLESNN